MSGEYKDYHYEDMLRVLNSYGIPESILKTQKVKDLANQQIESGSCDFFSGHGRITDMAGDPKDSVASYRKLSGWQLYSVNMFAEAECMMSTGELSSRKEQERIVGEKISENEGLFDGVDENQLTSFLKSNLSTIAWAAQQKKSKKDCRYQLKP